jgi:hypothetical protein
MTNRIDISDQLSPAFFQSDSAKKGKILTFQIEDDKRHFKIARLNKAKQICEVVEVTLHKPDEVSLKEVDRGSR